MSAELAKTIQTKIKKHHEEFENLKSKQTKHVESRQSLEAQLMENRMVAKTLKGLKEDAAVFKKIGPVMVKQSVADASDTVSKRMEFIESQMLRANEVMESTDKQMVEHNEAIKSLQAEFQAAIQAAMKGPGPEGQGAPGQVGEVAV
uniref:Prefoldin subunit 6 n=1 Tax=Chromera velia CCMP2878 TaxID=1169474 RepID=A0A0G4GKB5_9ALVE|mmetsp:Transcript_11169/g.21610  ORF Transcript_11169/g.21610 Transcript_11169/m.21610 type:complete len:147 (+) Transcript_11169:311-751(+)|eukprot:Cvel_22272.t1-p1 / transcript=Cvel_22272.t1 / gene=Cvel_22272 / organism=Chromera_velia_CCMP2878 / gene_product=Prefoldin subunit 6, putative / transcript_product=Prefoldin subunit 6, putative / location=Cvel_scaffold2172:27002-29197(-) / protein_length=146 / sequence_SO=supercontig / SO=protein_coding / is_pseudo=false